MNVRWCGLMLLCLALLPARTTRKKAPPATNSGSVVLTTSSSEARKLFEAGMADFENQRLDSALANWHAAVQKDRSLALAHLFIAEISHDTGEHNSERLRA